MGIVALASRPVIRTISTRGGEPASSSRATEISSSRLPLLRLAELDLERRSRVAPSPFDARKDRPALDDVGVVGQRQIKGVVARIESRLTRIGIGESGGSGRDEERGNEQRAQSHGGHSTADLGRVLCPRRVGAFASSSSCLRTACRRRPKPRWGLPQRTFWNGFCFCPSYRDGLNGSPAPRGCLPGFFPSEGGLI
jgi:hypothetical protein